MASSASLLTYKDNLSSDFAEYAINPEVPKKRSARIKNRAKIAAEKFAKSGVSKLFADIAKREKEIHKQSKLKEELKNKIPGANTPELGRISKHSREINLTYSPTILKTKLERSSVKAKSENPALKRQNLFKKMRRASQNRAKRASFRKKGKDDNLMEMMHSEQRKDAIEENKENLLKKNLACEEKASLGQNGTEHEESPAEIFSDEDSKEYDELAAKADEFDDYSESDEENEGIKGGMRETKDGELSVVFSQKIIAFEKLKEQKSEKLDDGLDDRIKESKMKTYRDNIFIDDCAVSDEEEVDLDQEEMTLEDEKWAKELISADYVESRGEVKSKAKLASSLRMKDEERVIERLRERFAPKIEEDSEEDNRIDFSKQKHSTFAGLNGILFNSKNGDFDRTKKDFILSESEDNSFDEADSKPPKTDINHTALKALMREERRKLVLEPHDDEESKKLLARINRTNRKCFSQKKPAENKMSESGRFLPHSQPVDGLLARLKNLSPRFGGNRGRFEGAGKYARKAKFGSKRGSGEKGFCVFATNSNSESGTANNKFGAEINQ